MDSYAAASANELSVQQLRSFCAVYEEGSYASAAKVCDFAAATIWEQVQAVERCYGVSLFSRNGRGIVPTKEAQVLFETLGPILTGLDSTFDVLKHGPGPRKVTLVTGMRMLSEELGAPLKKFSQLNPDICLALVHGDKENAERLVLSDAVDFGLTLAPRPNVEQRTIVYEKAYSLDYLALVPRDHPLAKRKRLRLKDIVRFPIIVGHSGTAVRQVLDEAFYRKELTRKARIVVETDNSAFTTSCVRAGLGVGILAGNLGGFLSDKLIGLPLRQELGHARIVFIWKQGRRLSRAASDLMKLIRDEISVSEV